MKRAIIAISLYLLLGLLTSIAVAWAATLWDFGSGEDYWFVEGEWRIRVENDPGRITIDGRAKETDLVVSSEEALAGQYSAAQLPSWSRVHDLPAGKQGFIWELAAGWPHLCLRCVTEWDGGWFESLGFSGAGAIEGQNPLASMGGDWSDTEVLPVGPVWTGLIANALLFAGSWASLAHLPLLWTTNLAVRRRRKGRCPWCGYDRRKSESERCPECGHVGKYRPALFSRGSAWFAAIISALAMIAVVCVAAVFASNQMYAPIHEAAWNNDVDAIVAELARGVDVDLPTRSTDWTTGATALWLAAMHGSADAIRCLADSGADLDARGVYGQTPLHIAASWGTAEAVSALVEAGADVNATDDWGGGPVFNAISRGDPGIRGFDESVLRILIDAGANLDEPGRQGVTPVQMACMYGAAEALRIILEAGASIEADTARFPSPLALAVGRGDDRCVQIMLDWGAEVDNVELERAVGLGRADLVRLFVEKGGDLHSKNDNGESLWFACGYRSSPEVWQILLEAGVDMNTVAADGDSTLIRAMKEQTIEIVQFFLEHGADPTIQAMDGRAAIDFAWSDEVRDLIQQAVDDWESRDPE